VEERWERGGREIGGGCCAGKTNEIEREGRGAHGGGALERAGIEAHNTRDHRSKTTRESKSET
jgi:hypothetical protein